MLIKLLLMLKFMTSLALLLKNFFVLNDEFFQLSYFSTAYVWPVLTSDGYHQSIMDHGPN